MTTDKILKPSVNKKSETNVQNGKLKTIAYYGNLAINMKLGLAKQERLLCTIRYLFRHGIEPNVENLATMSRKSLVRYKYQVVPKTIHKDMTII